MESGLLVIGREEKQTEKDTSQIATQQSQMLSQGPFDNAREAGNRQRQDEQRDQYESNHLVAGIAHEPPL